MNKLTEQLKRLMELGGTKRKIAFLVISGSALLMSLADINPLPFDVSWIAIVLCGLPIIMEAAAGLITAFDIKADMLVSLALIAAICIGEYFAAGEVAVIMQLGALLETVTVEKARSGIERLVQLTPQRARVIKDGIERIIDAEAVNINDVIRVFPGESVPVDGVIISGQTSINQAVITGEALPVDKTVGDEVSSGAVNQFGAFEMRAEKVGGDSSIQRMIRLVQSADPGKTKISGLADQWATWIVVTALAAAALTWLISGEMIRGVTVLVVFCPCALVLATPTAIMAAMGNAARHGFLIRQGDALEKLAKVTRITFDKTGTLTCGTPKVTAVHSILPGTDDSQLYRIIASAEQFSEHPLGKAVVSCCRKEQSGLPAAGQFTMIPGEGVTAVVNGNTVIAGNETLLASNSVVLPDSIKRETDAYLHKGCTVIYAAMDSLLAGYMILSDTIRKESVEMIEHLNRLGVQTVLLTGDHQNAAHTIGEALHIKEIHGNCLPEDKLNYISRYQSGGKDVCMIGDGINDAPALKKADVGIAMGGAGSSIAVDAADIALVDDEVKELPHLFSLSKRMLATIKLNLIFSMGLNFLAVTLAIMGILNPVAGALVHNAGSVAVIINSALLLGWEKA